MPITIGAATFDTERPEDLDAALLAECGCTADEARAWIKGTPIPGHVAMAVRPFLVGDELPTNAELGVMIAEAGTAGVARQVADLYDPPPVEPEDEAAPEPKVKAKKPVATPQDGEA